MNHWFNVPLSEHAKIDHLVTWCGQKKTLDLEALKIVEMVLDFMKNAAPPPVLISMWDSSVNIVKSFHFLGTTNTPKKRKKAQQRIDTSCNI